MIAKLGKELPERVIALSKSVMECCNRGNDCETRERATRTSIAFSKSVIECCDKGSDCATKSYHKKAFTCEQTWKTLLLLFFPIFLMCSSLIQNVTFLWVEISSGEANFRSATSVFTAFEERRGFDHSRVQFDDIVFSSAIKYSNSGSKRFRNMVYKYRNVGQLVALESKLIRAPRMRRIWLNCG